MTIRRWINANDAWKAATQGGAKGLGREDLGILAPGMKADLVIYKLDDIAFTPLNNSVNQLVYAQTGRRIDGVIVDGRRVMADGQLTQIDEAGIVKEINETHAELEPHIRLSEESVGRLGEAYQRIYDRCKRHPLAADTYPARLP